jgi:hypothetical protein
MLILHTHTVSLIHTFSHAHPYYKYRVQAKLNYTVNLPPSIDRGGGGVGGEEEY